MIRYLLLLVALCHADILIGDKSCLWKRPITEQREDYAFHGVDTMWMDGENNICFKHWKGCDTKVLMGRRRYRTDTTGWETYWDLCPRGK